MQIQHKILCNKSLHMRTQDTTPRRAFSYMTPLFTVLAALNVSPTAAQTTEAITETFPQSWFTPAAILIIAMLLIGLILIVLMKRSLERKDLAATAIRMAPSSANNHALALANSHYEGLANAAGMLARLLEDYLNSRYIHLFLIYHNNDALKLRLDEIAKESAENSFYYFCKFLYLLDRFERQENSTYLLSSRKTNEALQRFINTFIDRIPQGERGDAIDTLCIIDVLGRPVKKKDDQYKNVDLPLSVFSEKIRSGKQLKREFEAYKKWLLLAPPGIIIAAEVLSSYARLLFQAILSLHKAERPNGIFTNDRDLTRKAHESVLRDLSETARKAAMAESMHPSVLGKVTGKSTQEDTEFSGKEMNGKVAIEEVPKSPEERPQKTSGLGYLPGSIIVLGDLTGTKQVGDILRDQAVKEITEFGDSEDSEKIGYGLNEIKKMLRKISDSLRSGDSS